MVTRHEGCELVSELVDDTGNAKNDFCQNDQGHIGQVDQYGDDCSNDNGNECNNDNSNDYDNDYCYQENDNDQGKTYKELIECQRLAIELLFRNWLQEKYIDLRNSK